MSSAEPVNASLTAEQRTMLARIVAAAAPGARGFVFGSRVKGRNRPFSDVDLLIERRLPLTWQERAALEDAFEASDLPFRVDIVMTDELAEGFRQRVLDERIPL